MLNPRAALTEQHRECMDIFTDRDRGPEVDPSMLATIANQLGDWFPKHPRTPLGLAALWGFCHPPRDPEYLLKALPQGQRHWSFATVLPTGMSFADIRSNHPEIANPNMNKLTTVVASRWGTENPYHAVFLSAAARLAPPPTLAPMVLDKLLEEEEPEMRRGLITHATTGEGEVDEAVLPRYFLSSPHGLPQLFSGLGSGYVHHISPELRRPFRPSPREMETIQFVKNGYTAQQVTWRRGANNPEATATSVKALMEKYKASTPTQLAIRALFATEIR